MTDLFAEKPSLRRTFFRGLFRDEVGRVDYDLVRLASQQGGALSVRPSYLRHTGRGYPGGPEAGNDTPFPAIRHTPAACAVLAGEAALLRPPAPYKSALPDLARALFAAVVDYFVALWATAPDAPKLVLHSGGFDSRIMSLALREVRERIGTDAFGTVVMRCHQPENDLFRAIMRIQGWEDRYWSVWEGPVGDGQGAAPAGEDYYDVGRPGCVLNGYAPHVQTMNFWSDIIPPGDEARWIAVSGLGGEVFKYLAQYPKDPGRTCANRPLSLLVEHNPNRGEWEGYWLRTFRDLWMPFWSYDYLRLSTACPAAWCRWDAVGACDNVRMEIVRQVEPRLCHVAHGKHAYAWNISRRRRREMFERYRASAFVRDYPAAAGADPFSDLYGSGARLWSLATVYDAAISAPEGAGEPKPR